MIVFFQISLLEHILESVLKQDQFVEFIPPELCYFRETCKSQTINDKFHSPIPLFHLSA